MIIADVVAAGSTFVCTWVSPRAQLFVANVTLVLRHVSPSVNVVLKPVSVTTSIMASFMRVFQFAQFIGT